MSVGREGIKVASNGLLILCYCCHGNLGLPRCPREGSVGWTSDGWRSLCSERHEDTYVGNATWRATCGVLTCPAPP